MKITVVHKGASVDPDDPTPDASIEFRKPVLEPDLAQPDNEIPAYRRDAMAIFRVLDSSAPAATVRELLGILIRDYGALEFSGHMSRESKRRILRGGRSDG